MKERETFLGSRIIFFISFGLLLLFSMVVFSQPWATGVYETF